MQGFLVSDAVVLLPIMKYYPCHPVARDQRSRETMNDDAAMKNGAQRRGGERGHGAEERAGAGNRATKRRTEIGSDAFEASPVPYGGAQTNEKG